MLADPELVRPGDLEAIRGSADGCGVNYYRRCGRRGRGAGGRPRPPAGCLPGVEGLDLVVREPRTDIGWEVERRGLEELLVETTGAPACRW